MGLFSGELIIGRIFLFKISGPELIFGRVYFQGEDLVSELVCVISYIVHHTLFLSHTCIQHVYTQLYCTLVNVSN